MVTRTRAVSAAFGVALALALGAGGCGGGTRTVTQSGPPTTGRQVPATTDAATAPATAKPTGSGEPPARVVRLAAFQSPSGNIGCAIAGGVARCDIAQRSWQPPPRPPSCPSESDYGQGLEVERHAAAHLVCAGDTARDPSSPKLAYGTAAQIGGVTCVSRPTGITCTAAGGHGFAVSRQGYRVF
jgi:hypothetical protein